MEFFIFWFIVSILVAVFASTKNRSGFGWFLLSLVVSPIISFILLAILPRRGTLAEPVGVAQSLEGRLKEIERLKDSGLVTPEEYAAKRKAILESN